METLASLNPLLVALVAAAIGLVLGIGIMMVLERRKAGGKSVEKLREEFDDYRSKVADHFTETSDLFRDMTEKYRDVYNHLASGSQTLCEDPMQHARLEFADHEELAHTSASATDANDAQASAPGDAPNKAV